MKGPHLCGGVGAAAASECSRTPVPFRRPLAVCVRVCVRERERERERGRESEREGGREGEREGEGERDR